MKLIFKNQKYQTDAVNNTADVFAGQHHKENLGAGAVPEAFDMGVCDQMSLIETNADLDLGPNTREQLLANINAIQKRSGLLTSKELYGDGSMGWCELDVEMETGTGKTYVYIKTIFELHRRYGWSRFVVVVPSVAIREGTNRSFEQLSEHFFEEYHCKANYFVYNSGNLNQLRHFAEGSGIQVMIINTHAFATSMDESKVKNKASRIIYSERDEFGSHRPIDVLAATRPIVIIDEPQKADGKATQKGIRQFRPLFTINYSATHKTKHNCIYSLDAVDAYAQKLVKRISVKGFQTLNMSGSDGYIYMGGVITSTDRPPYADVEIEIRNRDGSIKRTRRRMEERDSLYDESNKLNQYKGLSISSIDAVTNSITLSDGRVISAGMVVGDSNLDSMHRLQIRETIRSHLNREEELYNLGIKTLSLFFIDEVVRYRVYDEEKNPHPGILAQMFEEEYEFLTKDKLAELEHSGASDPRSARSSYYNYLKSTSGHAAELHNGYFSVDKFNRFVDTEEKKTEADTDKERIAAYDLILKNREELMSFEQPVRFIFSHSALREGWDNPNVFQICTLRQSNSAVSKRQEVGRGLRLCVNNLGERMDYEALGDDIHKVNLLTVIANESYEDFVRSLQEETTQGLRDRPKAITLDSFTGKTVMLADGSEHKVTEDEADMLRSWMRTHKFIDGKGMVTDAFRSAIENNQVPALDQDMAHLKELMVQTARSTWEVEEVLKKRVRDENRSATIHVRTNSHVENPDFQILWKEISRNYYYTVQYDSEVLITNAVKRLNNDLEIAQMSFEIAEGSQVDAQTFVRSGSNLRSDARHRATGVKYDIVGDVARAAAVTRRTAARVLNSLSKEKLSLFAVNPERFIAAVGQTVSICKQELQVENICYELIDQTDDLKSNNIMAMINDAFDCEIKADTPYIKARKHITDVLVVDGLSENSVEKRFALKMDDAREVCVFAKLPRKFKIPTPAGDYSPDWAVIFDRDQVKHFRLVAETKGSVSLDQLRPVEHQKIECARKLFNSMSDRIRFALVENFNQLLDKANQD